MLSIQVGCHVLWLQARTKSFAKGRDIYGGEHYVHSMNGKSVTLVDDKGNVYPDVVPISEINHIGPDHKKCKCLVESEISA